MGETEFARAERLSRDLYFAKKEIDDLRAQLAEKDEEINLLKAKLEVCNDSRLRTYDGMAQKADVFDKLQSRHDSLREVLEDARGWVVTHAMQTYSKLADKCVTRIDEALSKDKADEVSGG